MTDFDPNLLIPADLAASLRKHGFQKIAMAVNGIADDSEKAFFTRIGTKLAMRQAQWNAINKGLREMKKIDEQKNKEKK